MGKRTPSLLALLGLVAVAGYQNREKISEFVKGLANADPNSTAGGMIDMAKKAIGSSPTATSITEGLGIFAMKNPWGLAEPCADGGGGTVPVEPGVEALVAQLRTVPGMAVTSEEMTIDGHRAAHVAVTTDAGIECPAGEISALTSKNVTSGWRWGIRPGDEGSLYVVELPDATYLLEYSGEGVTAADERAVMASVEFADTLPPAP